MKLSICVFIKNNNDGAFCLWESMAMLMPLADEFFVLDLGSTDGTWETLKHIAERQPKLRIEQGEFPVNPVTGLIDSGSFAVLPNQMIPTLKNDLVMYYQADEIFHEKLIERLAQWLESSMPVSATNGLSFWRYQLSHNFQHIKWFPAIVHRIGWKDRFTFVDDGMNTSNVNDAFMFSDYDAGWFTRWGGEYSKGRRERVDDNGNPYIYGTKFRKINDGKFAWEMPTHDMILDISSLGGFLKNIRRKAGFHAPYWRTDANSINEGGIFYNADIWYKKELKNADWLRNTTKFDIPAIMRPHLGQLEYRQRDEVIHQIIES